MSFTLHGPINHWQVKAVTSAFSLHESWGMGFENMTCINWRSQALEVGASSILALMRHIKHSSNAAYESEEMLRRRMLVSLLDDLAA